MNSRFAAGRLAGLWLAAAGVLLFGGLAGCQAVLPNSPPEQVTPPDHPLTRLYLAQMEGDAVDAGRAWLTVGDAPRAFAALSDAPLVIAETPLVQRIAFEAVDAGHWDTARRALVGRVSRSPTDESAQLELGMLLAVIDPPAAIAELRGLSAESPWSGLARDVADAAELSPEAVAWAMLQEGRWSLAEEAFRRALADASVALSPVLPAALALSRAYQGKDGAAWMARAIDRAPGDARIWSMQSILLRLNGDMEGSLNAQLRAASLAPENPAILAQLGAAYQRAGQLQDAAVWFERAQVLASEDPRFASFLDTLTQTEDQVRDAILDSLVTPVGDDSP